MNYSSGVGVGDASFTSLSSSPYLAELTCRDIILLLICRQLPACKKGFHLPEESRLHKRYHLAQCFFFERDGPKLVKELEFTSR